MRIPDLIIRGTCSGKSSLGGVSGEALGVVIYAGSSPAICGGSSAGSSTGPLPGSSAMALPASSTGTAPPNRRTLRASWKYAPRSAVGLSAGGVVGETVCEKYPCRPAGSIGEGSPSASGCTAMGVVVSYGTDDCTTMNLCPARTVELIEEGLEDIEPIGRRVEFELLEEEESWLR
jgi:hypothetical protein